MFAASGQHMGNTFYITLLDLFSYATVQCIKTLSVVVLCALSQQMYLYLQARIGGIAMYNVLYFRCIMLRSSKLVLTLK